MCTLSIGVFSLMPDEETTVQLLHDFFTHVHPLPSFAFLHKVTVVQRYRSGLLDRALLLALVGVTSLLTRGAGSHDYSTRCIDAAEALVFRDIGRQSVVKVQTLLLVTQHRMMMRRFSDAFVLFSVASRVAYGVRLNFENPALCFLARESRRRLMWALFVVDGSLASGLRDFRLCHPQSIHTRLPCHEPDFELDLAPEDPSPGLHPGDEAPGQVSAIAVCVRVSWIRYEVLSYTKAALSPPFAGPEQIQRSMMELEDALTKFADRLPPALALSRRNLQLRTYSHGLTPYVKIHILWHQSCCDLYRLTLEGLKEALPQHVIAGMDCQFVATCRRRCYESAAALSGVFSAMLALDLKPPLGDLDIPVCAYQCVRILFYSYRNYASQLALDAHAINENVQACLGLVAQVENPTPTILYIVSFPSSPLSLALRLHLTPPQSGKT